MYRSLECNIEDLKLFLPRSCSNFTVVTQNIRSIYGNHDDLQLNLSQMNFEADIVVLTECRLNPNKSIPNLNNYTSYYTLRQLNQNDGVVAYVNNNRQAHVTELNLTHASGMQIICSNCTILGIYRSPSTSNADDFLNSISSHLESIASHKNIVIIGDININLIHKTNENTYERNNRLRYLEVLALHGLQPGHKLPTRQNSCLDHVMMKLDEPNRSALVAILHTSVTDHQMVLLNISNMTNSLKPMKTKSVLDFHAAYKSLITTDISDFAYCSDPNVFADQFISIIKKALQSHTTLKVLHSGDRMLKPWMTTGALKCIRLRNAIQLKLKLSPTNQVLKITFKRYRNFCTNLIRKIKRLYFKKLITDSRTPKQLWCTVNEISQFKPPKSRNLELLNIMSNPKNSVNYVNNFFSNVGKTLAKEIYLKSPQSQMVDDFNNHSLNSCVLLETDHHEVDSILMSLESNAAPGWDGISTKFLKQCRSFVVPLITQLANLCFSTGIFPSALKRSIVTPVHKGGDRGVVGNYRPISVLTSTSKILEKIINNRLVNYLSHNKILSDRQYGFRKGRSTQDAIKDLTKFIIDKVDKGEKCITVFLDLKKAFDTVSVPILVRRLESVGIRGTQLAVLKNYLMERIQIVKIENNRSDEESVEYGVPQGSVLGPTLFLVYINQLCNLQNSGGQIYCYADDTAVVFSGRTWLDVQTKAETGLAKIADWLNANLLTLNIDKTHFMCFTPNKRSQPNENFSIKIHGCSIQSNCLCPEIKKVEYLKYLGVMIDQRLSWHVHLELISERIRKLIWIFIKLRYAMPSELLKKIYISLGQSVITYCIPIWGGATKSKFLYLERAQRALIKVMYFKPYRFPTNQLHDVCGLLSVRRLYILLALLDLHKNLPYDSRKLNLRRNFNVAPCPRIRTVFAERQYSVRSSKLYNKIDKILGIYNKKTFDCKRMITNWLNTLDYDKTENLLADPT
jgi:hypothetical protein